MYSRKNSHYTFFNWIFSLAGLRVVFNVTAPIGSRVASATVRCIECDTPVYLPLDRNATYRVMTQNYIGDGGGGYTVIIICPYSRLNCRGTGEEEAFNLAALAYCGL